MWCGVLFAYPEGFSSSPEPVEILMRQLARPRLLQTHAPLSPHPRPLFHRIAVPGSATTIQFRALPA